MVLLVVVEVLVDAGAVDTGTVAVAALEVVGHTEVAAAVNSPGISGNLGAETTCFWKVKAKVHVRRLSKAPETLHRSDPACYRSDPS